MNSSLEILLSLSWSSFERKYYTSEAEQRLRRNFIYFFYKNPV